LNHHLDFIHRTAVDFLLESSFGQEIMRSDETPESILFDIMFESASALCLLNGQVYSTGDCDNMGEGKPGVYPYWLPADLASPLPTMPSHLPEKHLNMVDGIIMELFTRLPILEAIVDDWKSEPPGVGTSSGLGQVLADFVNATRLEYSGTSTNYSRTSYLHLLDIFHVSKTYYPESYLDLLGYIRLSLELSGVVRPNSADSRLFISSTDWASNLSSLRWPFPVPIDAFYPPTGEDCVSIKSLDALVTYMRLGSQIMADAEQAIRESAIRLLEALLPRIGTWDFAQTESDIKSNFWSSAEHIGDILLYLLSFSGEPSGISALLNHGAADPNFTAQNLFPGSPRPLEVFLLSVIEQYTDPLLLKHASSVTSRSFVEIVQAFTTSGVDLDSKVCITIRLKSGDSYQLAGTWAVCDGDPLAEECLIIECNVSQLIDYAKLALDTYYYNDDDTTDPTDLWGNIDHSLLFGHEHHVRFKRALLFSKKKQQSRGPGGNDTMMECRAVMDCEHQSAQIMELFETTRDEELSLRLDEKFQEVLLLPVETCCDRSSDQHSTGIHVVGTDPMGWLASRGGKVPATAACRSHIQAGGASATCNTWSEGGNIWTSPEMTCKIYNVLFPQSRWRGSGRRHDPDEAHDSFFARLDECLVSTTPGGQAALEHCRNGRSGLHPHLQWRSLRLYDQPPEDARNGSVSDDESGW